MVYTLSNMLVDGLSAGGALDYGRATGGSTTTIVDTNRPDNETENQYKQGTAFIIRDSAGASAAPEGQFSRVTAYATGTGTFTLADTLTAAVASGDRYGLSSPEFQHDELIELANDALVDLGPMTFWDTSLTTADNQTEYTLPVALKYRDPISVWLQTNLGDADDNRPRKLQGWRVDHTTAGATSLLYLPQLASGYTIYIEYDSVHPAVNDFDDEISSYIWPSLAKRAMVLQLADRATEKSENAVDIFRVSFNKAKDAYEEAKREWKVNRGHKNPKLGGPGMEIGPSFTAGSVRLG